jgi:hypothetical protein
MFGAIISKESSQGTARLLEAMFETCLEKLEGLCVVQSEVSAMLECNKKTSEGTMNIVPDVSLIKKARPAKNEQKNLGARDAYATGPHPSSSWWWFEATVVGGYKC